MLRMLIADPQARQEAAEKAKLRIEEQYLWSGIARRTEEIYRALMLDRRGEKRPVIVAPGAARAA